MGMHGSIMTPRLLKQFAEGIVLSPTANSLMTTLDRVRALQTTMNSGFEGFNFNRLFVVQRWIASILEPKTSAGSFLASGVERVICLKMPESSA